MVARGGGGRLGGGGGGRGSSIPEMRSDPVGLQGRGEARPRGSRELCVCAGHRMFCYNVLGSWKRSLREPSDGAGLTDDITGGAFFLKMLFFVSCLLTLFYKGACMFAS